MNILWVSNGPHTPTGYGTQTYEFTRRLSDAGHKVTITANYGLQGAPIRDGDIMILPTGRDKYGNDVLVADAEHVGADIVITLFDVWVLDKNLTGRVCWCPWLPIDHDPAPPGVIEALTTAYQPIAYSQFGQRKLKEAGIKAVYIPHGIDTERYYPVDSQTARRGLGCAEDVFLVGMVSANKGAPSRKAFDQNIRAFGEFHKRHPDSMFYIHTDWSGQIGENIERIIAMAGIPQGAMVQPSLYNYLRGNIGVGYMREVYSAMDVLTNATRGEGFGLAIIEAQACGTPAIVGDYTSMPELITADTGYKVGYSDRFYSQESYQFTPSVDDIVEALEKAYRNRRNDDQRKACRQHIVDNYDAALVTEKYWLPELAGIESRIKADIGRLEPVAIEAKK